MRKSRFTEQQIIGMIKEHESGMSTAEVCRKHGISDVTPPRSFRHLFGGSVRLSCRFVGGGQGPLSGAIA